MRKNITTVMFLVFGLCGGTLLGIGLMFPVVQQTTDNANYWNGRYTNLNNSFNDLWDSYVRLWDDYDNLGESYLDLLNDYNALFSDYDALQEAFEEPLTAPVIPTISEVIDWLWYVDNTDELEYTEYWMCGDFSAMLMTRAKTMNWRVRIAVMEYSFLGDPNYDINTPFGEYGHAFNFIECSDGYLYYIEPQTDSIWYWSVVGYHFVMWSEYDFTTMTGTVWDGQILSVNYYNYFG